MMEAEPARARAAHPRAAIAVVCRALLGIAQDLVGLRHLLELRFGVGRNVPVGVIIHRQLPIGLFDLGIGCRARHSQQLVKIGHSSKSSTNRLVCCTRPMIFSYGMRVGPMTPITPLRSPAWYEEVTSVKLLSRGSRFSQPIEIESPACLRASSARRSKSRRSVISSSPRMPVLDENSGWSASICALRSTTAVP